MNFNKFKLLKYFFSASIILTLSFMLFIYFNLYSNLPKGFYIGLLISFFTILLISIYNFELSVLIFIFFIPLLGFLGPLFQTQDVYVILIMCAALIIGYLIRCLRHNYKILDFSKRFNTPVVLMLIIITISFILVIWRVYLFDFKMYGFLKEYISTDYFKSIKSTSIIYSIFFTGIFFQIIMTETTFSRKFIKKVFYVLIFSFFIVFVIGIYQNFFNNNFGVVTHWNYENSFQINSTLRFANTLGEYLIFIVPVFIGFIAYFYKTSKLKTILSSLAIIWAVILLYYNGNRTGILGVFIAFIFYILFLIWNFLKKIILKKIIKNYLKNIAAILIILIIAISLMSSIFFIIKNIDDSSDVSISLKRLKYNIELVYNYKNFQPMDFLKKISSGRNYLWVLAIDMFKDHPLSGVGIGQYEHVLIDYNIARYGKIIMHDAFACNYYLHVLAELGIFFLLSFFWLIIEVIWIFKKRIKLMKFQSKSLYLGIFIALIASLISYNFNAGTAFIEIQYMFSLIIGLLANKSTLETNDV